MANFQKRWSPKAEIYPGELLPFGEYQLWLLYVQIKHPILIILLDLLWIRWGHWLCQVSGVSELRTCNLEINVTSHWSQDSPKTPRTKIESNSQCGWHLIANTMLNAWPIIHTMHVQSWSQLACYFIDTDHVRLYMDTLETGEYIITNCKYSNIAILHCATEYSNIVCYESLNANLRLVLLTGVSM